MKLLRSEDKNMTNLILFFNSFLSYLLLFAVIVVLGVAAALIGINLRKKKDAKAVEVTETADN